MNQALRLEIMEQGSYSIVWFKCLNKAKGWFTIHSDIKMTYTPSMESAMQKAHKLGYKEYGRQLTKRLAVERKRHKEYEQSKRVTQSFHDRVYK